MEGKESHKATFAHGDKFTQRSELISGPQALLRHVGEHFLHGCRVVGYRVGKVCRRLSKKKKRGQCHPPTAKQPQKSDLDVVGCPSSAQNVCYCETRHAVSEKTNTALTLMLNGASLAGAVARVSTRRGCTKRRTPWPTRAPLRFARLGPRSTWSNSRGRAGRWHWTRQRCATVTPGFSNAARVPSPGQMGPPQEHRIQL